MASTRGKKGSAKGNEQSANVPTLTVRVDTKPANGMSNARGNKKSAYGTSIGKQDRSAEDFFGSLSDDAFFAGGPASPVQHVYFYGDVNETSLKTLRRDIDDACKSVVDDNGNAQSPRPIVLHVNSPGGYVRHGFSMMSIFNESRVPICACVDGGSYSAGTFLSILAPYRVMTSYSTCLVHDYAAIYIGKKDDLEFEVNIGRELTNTIKRVYLSRTRLKEQVLDELMQRDLLLTAAQCLDFGICDRVLSIREPPVDGPSRMPLPLEVVLKKSNLNHLRFDCRDVGEYAMDAAMSLDDMLSSDAAGQLKPVIIHADGLSCISRVLDHVAPLAYRIALFKADTYGVIDTHLNLIDLLPILMCKKRVMYEHARIVVHMVYHASYGWMLRDTVVNTEVTLELVRSILRMRTRMPPDIVDNIDKKRILLDCDDCLRYGIVHDVVRI